MIVLLRELKDDSVYKVVDLSALFEESHAKFSEGGMSIVLLHMSSTVLVKINVLAVTRIMEGIEGQENVSAYGINLVLPEEGVVEGPPCLASILLGCELLSCA
jgi:hypothetical protein